MHILELARSRFADFAPRLRFEHQSIYELSVPDDTFDLAACRHVIHAIPYADRVIRELARVTRPGGYLHLIPEDYGMLHFQSGVPDPQKFWNVAPAEMTASTGTDLFIGRNVYPILADLGLENIAIDYIVVDTLRVPRETFAEILTAWRDGYAEAIEEATSISASQATAYFNSMIGNVQDPRGYAVWMVPVASARKPVA